MDQTKSLETASLRGRSLEHDGEENLKIQTPIRSSNKIKVKINDNTPLAVHQSTVAHREDFADTAKKDGSLVESLAAANSEKKHSSVLYPGGSSDPLPENLYASSVTRAHMPHNSSTLLFPLPLAAHKPDTSSVFPTARADISGRIIKHTSNLDTMSHNTFSPPIELLTSEDALPQQNHIHSEFITQQN